MGAREKRIASDLLSRMKSFTNFFLRGVKTTKLLETGRRREVQPHHDSSIANVLSGLQPTAVVRKRVVKPAAPVASQPHAVFNSSK
jgi:hypothetical protein